MDGELVGRVVRLGRGWVEVDAGGAIRRVTLPPGLVAHVGNYVELRGDTAVSLTKNPDHAISSTKPLHAQASKYQQ